MRPILQRNSTVAILTLSWGGPAAFPDVFNKGIENINKLLGLRTKLYPTTLKKEGEVTAKEKVRDFVTAVQDPTIAGIISSIGGNSAVELLPLLDTHNLKLYSKPIIGFSDTTILLSYLRYKGYTVIYGPSVMAGFAQLHNLPISYLEHIREILFGTDTEITLPVFKQFFEGYPDWDKSKTIGNLISGTGNKSFEILQLGKPVLTSIWGGCIETLEQIKGTKYWPKLRFFQNKTLLFETSENIPSPNLVFRFLRNYGTQGILSKINGIIWGIPYGYNENNIEELKKTILHLIAESYKRVEITILFNVNTGHCDPKLLIPLNWNVILHKNIKLLRK